MASTSAVLLIGNNHPNDGWICPTHVARLVEGSRTAWCLHPLTRPGPPAVWLCADPSRLLDDLLALVAVQVIGHRVDPRFLRKRVELDDTDVRLVDALRGSCLTGPSRLALTATLSNGSALERFIPQLRDLPAIEVEVNQPTWSRRWNRWADSWDVSSSPHGGHTTEPM